jgi:two-component system, OmpR family, response regulator MtrA
MEMQTPHRPKVLVLDEIPSVIRVIELELAIQGFEVSGCEVGDATFAAVESAQPDVIVLEVLLPGITGFEMMRSLKARFSIPIVFLTTSDSDGDRAEAYELGADDYITKPFDPSDLGRRISALLGLSAPPKAIIYFRDLQIDLVRRIVRQGPNFISLSSNQWAILLALTQGDAEHPVPWQELLAVVAGLRPDNDQRLIVSWVERLRAALTDDPTEPQLILGSVATGYYFNPSDVRQ